MLVIVLIAAFITVVLTASAWFFGRANGRDEGAVERDGYRVKLNTRIREQAIAAETEHADAVRKKIADEAEMRGMKERCRTLQAERDQALADKILAEQTASQLYVEIEGCALALGAERDSHRMTAQRLAGASIGYAFLKDQLAAKPARGRAGGSRAKAALPPPATREAHDGA